MNEYEYKKRIADIQFEKQFILDKISALYDEKVAELEREFKEQRLLEPKKPDKNNTEQVLAKPVVAESKPTSPEVVPNNGRFAIIRQVEALDRVNYFGLIDKKQIMFCSNANRDEYIYLFCMQGEPHYGLSEEGLKYHEMIYNRPKTVSCHIAKVYCVQLLKNNREMWREIYKTGYFPFWDPILGPYDYNNKILKKIAFCKVYKVDQCLEKADAPGFIVHRKLTKARRIDLSKAELINGELYNNHLENILWILKKYDAI
jgi:hypothetical protein